MALLDDERPDTIPDRDHRPRRTGGVISPRRLRTEQVIRHRYPVFGHISSGRLPDVELPGLVVHEPLAVQVIHPRVRNHGMIEGFPIGGGSQQQIVLRRAPGPCGIIRHDAADAASAVAAPPLRVARVRFVEQVEPALVPHHVRSHTVEIFRTTSIIDPAVCNRIGSSHS